MKDLCNFWNVLNIALINCELSLTLTWSAKCVITSMGKREIPAQRDNSSTGATFKVTDTKLYVPVVTLSAQEDNKLLEQLKTRFKKL